MKWSIRKSEDLKMRIAKNEGLMHELSETVENIFRQHGIHLAGKSYVFEPRVFTMTVREAPEAKTKSREAMIKAILEYFINRSQVIPDFKYLGRCIPECGGMDPVTLRILEKFRITDQISDDPVPITDSEILMRRMVGNKELMADFSKSVFEVLKNHGITFRENEGCVFTPMVFETPVYAQKVGKARTLAQVQGFGPQVYAEPAKQAETKIKFIPFPGIIDFPGGRTPGVIIHDFWWVGIPAPEMLKALDMMRNM